MNKEYSKYITDPQIEVFRSLQSDQLRSADETPASIAGLDASSPPRATGPLYGGKPLAAWLEIFEHERSREGLKKTLYAMSALASDASSSKQIEEVLLKVLPTIHELLGEDENLALDTLIKCQPNERRFFELLASELDKADAKWAEGILSYMVWAINQRSFSNIDDFEPLRMWINSNVFQSDKNSNLLQLSASVFLRAQYSLNANESQRKVLIDDLLACKKLGFDFWLVAFPIRLDFIDFPWTPQFAAVVESKAVQALRESKTDARLVVQALIVLEVVNSKEYKKRI